MCACLVVCSFMIVCLSIDLSVLAVLFVGVVVRALASECVRSGLCDVCLCAFVCLCLRVAPLLHVS